MDPCKRSPWQGGGGTQPVLAVPSRGMGCSTPPGRVGGCGGEGQGGYFRYPGVAVARTWLLRDTGAEGYWGLEELGEPGPGA